MRKSRSCRDMRGFLHLDHSTVSMVNLGTDKTFRQRVIDGAENEKKEGEGEEDESTEVDGRLSSVIPAARLVKMK